MHKGIVKWFDETKGYGYIEGDNGTQIFVHFTDIIQEKGFKTLSQGEFVKYDIVQGEMGAKAKNVVKY